MTPDLPARTSAADSLTMGMPRAWQRDLIHAAALLSIPWLLSSHCARLQLANPHSSRLSDRALPLRNVHAARSYGTRLSSRVVLSATACELAWMSARSKYD